DFTETVQQHSGSTFMDLFSRKYARPLIIGIGLMALMQFRGNNAITTFASSIFRAAGIHIKVKIILQGCSADSASQVIAVLQSRVLSLQKKLEDDFLCWLWSNLDKIDNIQQLRKLEDSISKSLNEIAKHTSSCDILVRTSSRLHVSIAFSGILRKMKFREMLLSDSATNMSKPGTSIGKGQEKKGDIELKFFELHDLKAVTDNFSPDNKFGEGGFGPAFKVLLLQPGYLQVCNTNMRSHLKKMERNPSGNSQIVYILILVNVFASCTYVLKV
ncbi:hypothetical protein MTR67_047348, partial [Solanum verrucosum]